VCDFGFAR
jgi:cyclin-dependent kinase-like